MIPGSFRERGREHRSLQSSRDRAEGVLCGATSTMHSAVKRSAVEEARNQQTKEIDIRGGFEWEGGMYARCELRFATDAFQAPPPIPPGIRTASARRNGRVSLDLATEGISGSIADRLTLGTVPRKMP